MVNNEQSCTNSEKPPVSLVIASFLELLEEKYVFPDVTEQVREVLEQRLRNGEYESVKDSQHFASILTEHVYEILKDKHVRVYFAPSRKIVSDNESSLDRNEFLQRTNYAFRRVERLSGNIGYLDLVGFVELCETSKTVAEAAMTFLAYTDAMIVDLRSNGGGYPDMITYLTSYLFSKKSIHLNSMYWRSQNTTEEFWTYCDVLGPRYGINKPVFVLIGERTFSGAEEFAYNLQALNRASVIGAVTAGGAHPCENVPVYENYYAKISVGRAINPYTKTNWEGVGVIPDIAVSSSMALYKAHLEAINTLLATEPPQEILKELEEARQKLVQQNSHEFNEGLTI